MATNRDTARSSAAAIEPNPNAEVRSRSNRMNATALIPKWMSAGGPMPWRCDGRTTAIFKNFHAAGLRALVSLRCGFDPDQFDTNVAFEQAVSAWRTQGSSGDPAIQVFLCAFDQAIEAVMAGQLQISEKISDPVYETLVVVDDFMAWTERVQLVGVGDPREFRTPWGRYTTPLLDKMSEALSKHYRLKADGGAYDFEDAETHPHPSAIRATLRSAGLRSGTAIDIITKIARDPRIPVGRRRK